MNSRSLRLVSILAILLVAALAAPSGVSADGRDDDDSNRDNFRLTLLHNNDGESKLATGSSVPGYGGAARFATVVERLRAEAAGRTNRGRGGDDDDDDDDRGRRSRATLLVSSGDNFLAGLAILAGFESGPPWPDATVANLLGYDAMTIGNHEFDFGQARLAEYIQGVDRDIPFITANLGFDDTIPELRTLARRGRIVPSVVVRRGGSKVGIIGLTTPDITSISSPGNVEIRNDLANVVNEQVRRMQRRNVNKIIVSAHLQGIAADEALIPMVRGVDIWIAGGGDDLLANPDDTLIGTDQPVGPYPKPVEDSRGDDVLVVSTAGEYKYVGRLTVEFSRRGRVIAVDDAKSGPVRVSGTATDPDFAPEDAEVKAQAVDPVAAFSAGLASQLVGTTEVPLIRGTGNDPIRRRESGFGNLVADSYLWKAQQLAAADPQVDEPQVVIGNGGGIRQDIPAGPINKAQTFSTLPFFNQIVVVEDVGCEQLRQLLERGYSGLPAAAGQFANIAGMRVEVDPMRQVQVLSPPPTLPVTIVTPGQRVRNLWLSNGTPQNTADDTQLVSNGAVVPGCAPVDLATVDFTVRDGDRYPFTAQGLTTFTSVGALYNEALEDYIMAPAASGGLGGVVTAARYSMVPSGVRRITIQGD
ncbi:MAG TPA: bifunctional metallophosphatase/5'-nucleotidase [Streptosporangiaceae bacterium]|nr:bifunctional metallophosphatase/5'-nucleotidase [Streptosporangiaceae bacterium]